MDPEGAPSTRVGNIESETIDMSRYKGLLKLCVVAALLSVAAAACGSDDVPALVTTTSRVVTTAASTTTAPELETTTVPDTPTMVEEPAETAEDASDTETDAVEASEIFYRVVRQEPTRDGNRLFLEIPSGSYTDRELENLVLSVYEERDDLYEVHVFDNRDAVEVLVKAEEERTADESELLDRHYLVSLLEGSILRFQGPFANLEGFIIGS